MKRLALSVAAVGLVGANLPLGSSASAIVPVAEEPAFSGYSSSAWAAPVRLEVYDPSIPIPASPQFEVEFGYSLVEADSGSSHGRASFVWPGDPIGEGLKTIVEQMGLPPKLGEAGYPLQVNSIAPGGPAAQRDEPLPGTIMRTRASAEETTASTGFSPDGESQDPEAEDPEGQTSPLSGLLGLLSTEAPAAAAPSAPGIPMPVGALVDFGGYQSTSRTAADTAGVEARSRTTLGEVSLLGGIVQLSGISSRSVSTSDGAKGVASGRSTYGSMRIAGQEFSIGPDGVVAAGKTSPIPGLPDDPAKALAKLGLTIEVPKARFTRDGDQATSVVEGLRIQIDTTVLRPVLDVLPLGQLLGKLPDQLGQLKSVLIGVASLAPRFVITLGVARSTVDTVQAIPVEPPPAVQPEAPGPSGSSGTGSTGVTAPPVDTPVAEPPAAAGGDPGITTPVSAGLPPLFSIPGVLLLGSIALAAAAGSYLRKLGVLALGGGACPHGLDSGLPDLRKA